MPDFSTGGEVFLTYLTDRELSAFNVIPKQHPNQHEALREQLLLHPSGTTGFHPVDEAVNPLKTPPVHGAFLIRASENPHRGPHAFDALEPRDSSDRRSRGNWTASF